MHEVGIMTGVLAAVDEAAINAGALKVLKVSLSVGEMTEAIEESLRFAFEILTENTITEGAELEIKMISPRSVCEDCGYEFSHSRFQVGCPLCDGINTTLIAGKELQIDSIEVDLPDEEDSEISE